MGKNWIEQKVSSRAIKVEWWAHGRSIPFLLNFLGWALWMERFLNLKQTQWEGRGLEGSWRFEGLGIAV